MNGQRVAAWSAAGIGVLVIAMMGAFNNRLRQQSGDGYQNVNYEVTDPQPRLELIDSGTGAPPKEFETALPYNSQEIPSKNAAAWMRFRLEKGTPVADEERKHSAVFEATSLDGKHFYRTRSYRHGDEYLMVVNHDYPYAAQTVIVSSRTSQNGFSSGSSPVTFRLPKLLPPLKRIPTGPKVPAKFHGSTIYAVRVPKVGGGNAIVFVAENAPTDTLIRVHSLIQSTFAELKSNYASFGPNPGNSVGREIGTFTIPDAAFADHVKLRINASKNETHLGRIVVKSLAIEEVDGKVSVRCTEVESFTIGPAKISTDPTQLAVNGSTPFYVFVNALFRSEYGISTSFDHHVLIDRGVQLTDPRMASPASKVDPMPVKYGPIGPVRFDIIASKHSSKTGELTVPVFDNDEVKEKLGFEPLKFLSEGI